MNTHKTHCQWCPQLYSSPGAYSNHLAKVHPGETLTSNQEPKIRKRRLSDVSDHNSSSSELEIARIREILLSTYESSDAEVESEGSDREARDYSSDTESDEESPKTNGENAITEATAGIPIREYGFAEQDPAFDFYSPFRHAIDYRLARFFNAVQASEKKIDHFFKAGILKDLNPTHQVQFKSAYTMYKLVDEAADEPRWHSGKVDYPLLKGVQFRYRNIISAVKYLLRQKIYAADMVWGPRPEYDKQGNRMYSEINTGTWWEDTQVRNSNA
jgi:hypothetical protein